MARRIKLNVYDVHDAGSVQAAIEAWCEQSDLTASGVIGSSFATSGPGSGWTVEHDVDDYARRAAEGGAMYYVDSSDGRMVGIEEVSDDEEVSEEEVEGGNSVVRDGSGGLCRLGEWSEASVVRLECPSLRDATDPEYAATIVAMAQAVVEYHYAESDCEAWWRLVERIRDAAEALEDIDLDDLAERAER